MIKKITRIIMALLCIAILTQSTIGLVYAETSSNVIMKYYKSYGEVYSRVSRQFNRQLNQIHQLMSDVKATDINKHNFHYMYLKQEGKQAIEIKENESISEEMKQYGIGLWLVTKPYANIRRIDTCAFDKFLDKLPAFSESDVVELDAKDLSIYGLDKPDIELILKDKNPLTKEISGVHYIFSKADSDKENVYFKYANKNVVYRMKKKDYDRLDLKAFDIAEKLIYIVNISKVAKIDITSKSLNYTLMLTREVIDGQQKEIFKIEDRVVEDSSFRNTYQSIIGISADLQVEDSQTISTDSAENVTITYHLSDNTKKEITYYKYNDEYYITKIEQGVYFACPIYEIEKMFNNLQLLSKGEEVNDY